MSEEDIYDLESIKEAMTEVIEREERLRKLSEKLTNIDTTKLIKLNKELSEKIANFNQVVQEIQPELSETIANLNQVVQEMQPELSEKMKHITKSITKIENEMKRRQDVN